MICHAQHSMLNHIHTLWFSTVILFGIHLIVGLLRAGGQVQTLSNEWKLQRQSKSLTNSAVYPRSKMWQRREAAGNCKRCFERKNHCWFIVVSIYLIFSLCITRRPADCHYCLRFLYLSFPHWMSVFCRFSEYISLWTRVGSCLSKSPVITPEWWYT